MNNVLPLIDMKSDKWILPSSDDLDYGFRFDFLPNEWLKHTVKAITRDSIAIGRLKLSTLYRYNYQLQYFCEYLESTGKTIDTFADVTFAVIEEYIFYLLQNVKNPASRSIAMASLKFHIKHGQLLDWEGFPQTEVFDGTERRTLQYEDSLKSRLIDDYVIDQIDTSLQKLRTTIEPTLEHLNDIILWTLITVVRHTGLRISEALHLKADCLRRDLLKKYLLEVVSEKNQTERFIPVGKEVAVALELLKKVTEDLRSNLGTDKLFYYYQVISKRYTLLRRIEALRWLKEKFLERFNVKDRGGKPVNLTYHQFRHHIGTDLLNNGLSPFEVMQYLGHDSMHSTRLYAKVRTEKLGQEYQKVGFIGVIKNKEDDIVDKKGSKPDAEKRLMAQLPDGVCAKPIDTKVANCKKPNACLFCPKFITTPEFLEIHKDHLERIRADKVRYMAEDLFGNDYLLFETEKALVEIIYRLEALSGKEDIE